MHNHWNVGRFATLLLLAVTITALGLSQGNRAAQATPAGAPGMTTGPALGCRVAKTAIQALPNGTLTPLVFDVQINDVTPNDNCWTPAEPTRLYARASGYYIAGGSITLGSGTLTRPNNVRVIIRKGGTVWLAVQTARMEVLDDSTFSVATGMFHLNDGEYIEIIALQWLGNNITTYRNGPCEHCLNGWLIGGAP